jgi:hypothetical protein
VRKALDEGYEVRCIVKPRMNPADFLRDWGATTVQVRELTRGAAAGAAICLQEAVVCLQLSTWRDAEW